MKDNDFVTVIDVYSRNPNGGIDHYRLLPTVCDDCATTHDSPCECPCDRCAEGLQMSREILFRGKRKDDKGWVTGDLRHGGYYNGDREICIMSLNSSIIINHPVYPETVGQFTGLTDKNGKKIFEGDVVRFEDIDGEMVVCVVLWGANGGRWELDVPATGNRFAMSFFDVVVEVIGNLHDNPELLEVSV